MNSRLAVAGDVYLQWLVEPAHFPAAGETVVADRASWRVGGHGALQAMAAAHLGGQVLLWGHLGEDPFADLLRTELREAGVGLAGLSRSRQSPSGVAFTWVNAAGQSQTTKVPGANACYEVRHLEHHQQGLAQCGCALLSSGIPEETLAHAARLARQSGAKVILDPAADTRVTDELLAGVDYVILNEETLALLTRAPLCDFSQAIAALKARELRGRGVPTVIVKLGPLGALLVKEDLEHLWRPPAGASGDVTQSADLFAAAFAVALASGKTDLSAGKFAVAAAACKRWQPGEAPVFPSLAEVEHYLKPPLVKSQI
ncbi:MAG TPA: PfkB family carbohydrate kinase [Candidatus Paceibacterota bacterium]|nr:PfkB family carbohydrate kinase [Verrucomicrobiota bacterium]HRY49874.1 PfkB family carbohydrate kinase [Candidatus Paceibacterota bacterium]HSA02268.1 PfkB family carbohydrate kinase [Candidatus Paceibacterota bacterium]